MTVLLRNLVAVLLVGTVLILLQPRLTTAMALNCLQISNLLPATRSPNNACETALKRAISSPHLHLAWGTRYLTESRFEEAQAVLRQAHQAMPDSDLATYLWQAALGATGRFADLRPGMDSARGNSPLERTWLSQARRRAAMGDWVGAQAAYELAIQETLQVEPALPAWLRAEASWLLVRRLEASLSAEPSLPELHYRLGRAYARLGRWQDAQTHLSMALKVNTALKQGDKLYALVKLGQAKTALGDWVSALETLQATYESGNRHPELMLQLITSLRRAGDEGEARRLEQELAQLGPRFPINAPMRDGWILWGYDLDELELEEGSEVTLYLYWRRNDGRCDSCLIVKPYNTLNLAFDGSFEWSAKGQPSGPEASLRPSESCSSFVEQRARSSTMTSVLFIARATEGDRFSISGCYSHKASVESGATYLLRGLISGQGQSIASFALIWGTRGRPWFPSEGEHYAIQGPVAEWQEYHAVSPAPQEATFGLVRMMRQQTAGWVAYDNVLFARLPRKPEQLQTRNAEHLSGLPISALILCHGCP